MGYNTTVVVMNDALDQIKNDPKFGEKLYYACLSVQRGKPVNVSAGYHINAATVIEIHNANQDVLVRSAATSELLYQNKKDENEQLCC